MKKLAIAVLAGDGRLRLNNEELGAISDTANLEDRLLEIFKEREMNGIFVKIRMKLRKLCSLRFQKQRNTAIS